MIHNYCSTFYLKLQSWLCFKWCIQLSLQCNFTGVRKGIAGVCRIVLQLSRYLYDLQGIVLQILKFKSLHETHLNCILTIGFNKCHVHVLTAIQMEGRTENDVKPSKSQSNWVSSKSGQDDEWSKKIDDTCCTNDVIVFLLLDAIRYRQCPSGRHI